MHIGTPFPHVPVCPKNVKLKAACGKQKSKLVLKFAHFCPCIIRVQIVHKNSRMHIGSPFPHVPPVLQVYRHLGVGDSCEAQKFSDTCVEKLRTLSRRERRLNDTLERHWPTPVRLNLCLQIASSPVHLASSHIWNLLKLVFTNPATKFMWGVDQFAEESLQIRRRYLGAKRRKCAQRGEVKVWRKGIFLSPVPKIKDNVKVKVKVKVNSKSVTEGQIFASSSQD